MERFNSEGIVLKDLALALRDRRTVMVARRINTCLLCRRTGVTDCGLCEICYSMLDGENFNLAEKWLSGRGP